MKKLKRRISVLLTAVMLCTLFLPMETVAYASEVNSEETVKTEVVMPQDKMKEETEMVSKVDSEDTETQGQQEESEGSEMGSKGIELYSMRPLEEVKAYLVVSDYSDEEIKNMPLSTVLKSLRDSEGNSIEIPETATAVWSYFKDEKDNILQDEYHIINKTTTVDLSMFEYTKDYTMELIVGSGKQLDPGNVRYLVKVYLTKTVSENINCELYVQNEGNSREKIVPQNINVLNSSLMGVDMEMNTFIVPTHKAGREYYLGISSAASEHPDIKVDIYTMEEFIKYLSGSDGTPITNKILNQDMTKVDAGYKGIYDCPTDANDWKNIFWLVHKDEKSGSLIAFNAVSVQVTADIPYVTSELWAYEDEKMTEVACESVNYLDVKDFIIDAENGSIGSMKYVYSDYYMLKEGYAQEKEYFCALNAHSDIWDDANTHVVKAVVGQYESLEAAAEQEDIKEQLIPVERTKAPYGYKANYSYQNGGVDFTIFFDDNTVWKFNVTAMGYKPEFDTTYMMSFNNAPIVGAKDPWFRVDGVKQGDTTLDTYVVENGKAINMDTLYGYGYQTIFINDKTADLSSLKPTFWFGNADRVETYAVSPTTGNKQLSGESVRDFSNGSAQYGTVIDDNVKNYQVNFVKKESGAKLYVNGPSERTIFLDEYFENKHDILIANVGDTPLNGINVELLNAKNVKLDDYWTVGGTDNDTLAPFTTTEVNSKYGELANLAKIRLVKDGDKSGEIEGTLKISADGQEDVYIKLSGRASNPSFVTEKLDEAVKYVPYSYLVATNNMNEWNKVTFTIESGSLPSGLELFPTTGEIYGVPQESGTFNIRVKASYSRDDYFDPSYVDLTLIVKENTDENVYLASDKNDASPNLDDGYTIKQHIGAQIGEYSFELEKIEDTEFTSYGHYEEFVGLWLNGKKLVEGTDYNSESGSTKITINSQTFENNAESDNANTIAMEFRKDSDGDGKGDSEGELNRTSQNFVIAKPKTDPAVENVIALINKIPGKVTLDAKPIIQKARKAYDDLNAAQKTKVTNYSRLTAAENAIKVLEENAKDKAEADKVTALINAIPNPVTLECKNAVVAARNAYNMLTANQKSYVAQSYVNKLNAAEKTIADLEAAQREEEKQQAQINDVIAKINALPENITLQEKGAVADARDAYNALSAAQKEKVMNYEKLVSAEKAIKALEALEEADEKDKAAANAVIGKINVLPETITLEDKPMVEEARKAYNSLTDTQKELVVNYSKLEKAEKVLKALAAYQEADEKDKEVADKVIGMIEALPENVVLSDRKKIETAREAYEALTESQKAIIINYDKLVAAEVALAEAEKEDYENNKEAAKITFVGTVVDKSNKPLADSVVEIHSTVQIARTDKNGYFRFTDVEMGEHTLTIKDKSGKVTVKKHFTIVEGAPLSLKGDVLTARDGEVFTVRIKVQGGTIEFTDIEKGDKTPDNIVNNDETINIDGAGSNPGTGDNSRLVFWYVLLMLSLLAVMGMVMQSRKRRV